ncbi:MAG: hypothetical protein ACE367_21215 [Acidimicrobiales bacterium]
MPRTAPDGAVDSDSAIHADTPAAPDRAAVRSVTTRSAQGAERLRLAALVVGALAMVLTIAPAIAQQGGGNADRRLDVTVTAQGDAPRRNIVTVDVDGLSAFAEGTLVVYQCGNADRTGRPIEPTEDDCFAPDDDGYTTVSIEDEASATVRYQIARRGIGANAARCIPTLDGAAPCQIVVGAVDGADAEIVGVALDDVLADLDEAAAADRPGTPGAGEPVTTLPVTGPGTRGVAIALFIAAGCLYTGSLLRSATQAA